MGAIATTVWGTACTLLAIPAIVAPKPRTRIRNPPICGGYRVPVS